MSAPPDEGNGVARSIPLLAPLAGRIIETAEAMMDIGGRLAKVRDLIPHGAWLPWLFSETGMSESWSRGCMNLYRRFGDNPGLIEELDVALPPTAIVRLSTAPDNAFEDIVDRLRDGQKLRVQDVEHVIKEHRARLREAKGEGSQAKATRGGPRPEGADSLRVLADRARDVLIPDVISRIQNMLDFLEDADERIKSGKRVTATELYALRDGAQWLTDALEQLTQCAAGSQANLVHRTFVPRRKYEPGPWADAASFLADISSSDDCRATIKAAGVPSFVARGVSVLSGVLQPGSESPPLPEGLESKWHALRMDGIVCLEDGREVRDLGAHLATLGITPDEYRRKWSLPDAYPMQAPAHIIRHGDTYEYDPEEGSFRQVS